MNNIEILIDNFEQLKKIKFIIESIDPEFFFKFGESLIKENKELKEKNNRIKSLDYTTLAEEMEMGLWMPRADVEEYYIPIERLNDYIEKSKVKEKIEELEKEIEEKQELKGLKGQDRYFIKQIYQAKRIVLEELLEEGE